jgi:hypothetical protein
VLAVLRRAGKGEPRLRQLGRRGLERLQQGVAVELARGVVARADVDRTGTGEVARPHEHVEIRRERELGDQ